MSQGEALDKRAIAATQHFTEPPPRYSEASLVKRMEELGIGRPSTYASILQVLKDRSYVRLDKKRLVPEDKGRVVVAFLENFFARYVEYDFTASLEEQLDRSRMTSSTGARCCATSGAISSARSTSIKDVRVREVLDVLDEILAPHLFPQQRGRHRSARLHDLRHRPAGAQARHASAPSSAARTIRNAASPAASRANGAGAAAQSARHRSGDRPRRHDRDRPLRHLFAARRNLKDKDEKPKRACIPKGWAIEDIDLERRSICSRCRARLARTRRTASRSGRHRTLRALRAARQDLREPRLQRGRADYRAQSRRHADRREDRQSGQGPPLRRRSRPFAWRPSDERRADPGQEGPLRPLREQQRHQRHDPGCQDPGRRSRSPKRSS